MSDTTTFTSRYEKRVTFVATVIEENSALAGDVAHDLAVKVIHAVDHIPEQSR
jgi:hypothetical protein